MNLNFKQNSDNSIDQQYSQFDNEFSIHEMLLRDRQRVTAYYDAIMNNRQFFKDKVIV